MGSTGRLDALRRDLRSRVLKRVFRDDAGGPERAVLIAGVARSGTTWLAELICSQLSGRILFEPFNNRHVSGYRTFEYVQYMRPEQDDPELLRFVTDVLGGTIRDPHWIDRMVDSLRPEYRVAKAVRACLMLGWIHARFPRTPTLLIVRHPCAVVASFQNLGWTADLDVASMAQQHVLVQDHLTDCPPLMDMATLPHQKTALAWCISNRVALRQAAGTRIAPFYYENLVRRPQEAIPAIFNEIGQSFDGSVFTHLRRPSRTTKSGRATTVPSARAPGWAGILSSAQVDDVMEIVAAFGLGDLYDGQGRPTGRLGEPV